jgi:Na+/H+-dicarboxylate symporter
MAFVPTTELRIFGLGLWQQVLIAMVIGVATGMLMGPDAAAFKTLGDLFLTLIKMLVVPLIFLAIVTGLTSLENAADGARLGGKAAVSYLLTAMFAATLGLTIGILMDPGAGIDLDALGQQAVTPAAAAQGGSFVQFLLQIVPSNVFKAAVEDHYLQVVFFSIFTGVAMLLVGEGAAPARQVVHAGAAVTFKMIGLVVTLAPLAVFGFMAWMMGVYGVDLLVSLGRLVGTVLMAFVVQFALFGVLLAVFGRIKPWPFYRKMLKTQLTAFSTSSSKATVPLAMQEMQTKMGVSARTTNFTLPLGACLNMDGIAIYMAICSIFFARIYGVELHFHEYLILIVACTLGSIGAAGIPSGSIIFMGVALSSVGIPVEGVGILLGIDRLLDMIRTVVNLTGDCAVTLMVDATEGTLDKALYYASAAEIAAAEAAGGAVLQPSVAGIR